MLLEREISPGDGQGAVTPAMAATLSYIVTLLNCRVAVFRAARRPCDFRADICTVLGTSH